VAGFGRSHLRRRGCLRAYAAYVLFRQTTAVEVNLAPVRHWSRPTRVGERRLDPRGPPRERPPARVCPRAPGLRGPDPSAGAPNRPLCAPLPAEQPRRGARVPVTAPEAGTAPRTGAHNGGQVGGCDAYPTPACVPNGHGRGGSGTRETAGLGGLPETLTVFRRISRFAGDFTPVTPAGQPTPHDRRSWGAQTASLKVVHGVSPQQLRIRSARVGVAYT
jgi:hypothetical protein